MAIVSMQITHAPRPRDARKPGDATVSSLCFRVRYPRIQWLLVCECMAVELTPGVFKVDEMTAELNVSSSMTLASSAHSNL